MKQKFYLYMLVTSLMAISIDVRACQAGNGTALGRAFNPYRKFIKTSDVPEYITAYVANRVSTEYAPVSKVTKLVADQLPSYIRDNKFVNKIPLSKETCDRIVTAGLARSVLCVIRFINKDGLSKVIKEGKLNLLNASFKQGIIFAGSSIAATALNAIVNPGVTYVAKKAHCTKWFELAQSNPELNALASALVTAYIGTHLG